MQNEIRKNVLKLSNSSRMAAPEADLGFDRMRIKARALGSLSFVSPVEVVNAFVTLETLTTSITSPIAQAGIPAAVTALGASSMGECAEKFKSLEGRLDDLERVIVGQKGNMHGDIARLQGDISLLQGDISLLQGDTVRQQGDIDLLLGDVARQRCVIRLLQGDTVRQQGDISLLQGDTVRQQGDIDLLQGKVDASAYATFVLYVGEIAGELEAHFAEKWRCSGNTAPFDINAALIAHGLSPAVYWEIRKLRLPFAHPKLPEHVFPGAHLVRLLKRVFPESHKKYWDIAAVLVHERNMQRLRPPAGTGAPVSDTDLPFSTWDELTPAESTEWMRVLHRRRSMSMDVRRFVPTARGGGTAASGAAGSGGASGRREGVNENPHVVLLLLVVRPKFKLSGLPVEDQSSAAQGPATQLQF